ncbi:protein FAM160B1-like [Scyliorhinus canicula]|uniref:protein FAM160B1-like n=1 Tax=Scyliorhinus canicula TaxID=7830 RepID=UPI0018F763A7|nr:protein FAM160B1-like [Scyliorhinus canicula]
MFTKFTNILQQAVEALAPSLPLQEDFVFHWKAITHYYIDTSDDKAPVTDTNIPSHLDQMLDTLVQEENERESGETGPCMEYLLHHKILETLYTLGKADCPPGMKQQVLIFYTKLLGRIKQPLLPHINVHRPVQKLIRLCGEVLAAPTENEEIQFLCIVCAKLKQDPYLVNFFLENKSPTRGASSRKTEVDIPDKTSVPEDLASETEQARSSESDMSTGPCNASCRAVISPLDSSSESSQHSTDLSASLDSMTLSPQTAAARSSDHNQNQDYNLVNSLINLSKSPDGRIVVKASEGLMLLVSLPEPAAAKCLTDNTSLCQLLTERLGTLYRALPQSIDAMDIESLESVNWGLDSYSHKEDAAAFPGKRALISFLSWLDYCDQLIKEAHKLTAVALARAIRERFFVPVMEPQLLQTSEIGILTSISLLNRIIRQITSNAMLRELVFFLLGEQRQPETAGDNKHQLRYRLIEHCDHLSDEVNIVECNVCFIAFRCFINNYYSDSFFVKKAWTIWHYFYTQTLIICNFLLLFQPYDVNLQVTSVLSKLSLFPHPHLHEYLLDPYINLAPNCRSLFSVIVRVVGDLMLRIQRIPDFTPKLLLVRKRLLGVEPDGPIIDHMTLLEGVIVLEEFCKELAAIAFVKFHASTTP